MKQVYTPAGGRMEEAARHLLEGAAKAADEGELHWSRLQEAPTCWHDRTGRVLFPGDAGHPMVPTLGQGATTAIEDAATFIAYARHRLGDGAGDVPALVRSYAASRQERIEFVRRFSWEASDVLIDTGTNYAAVRAKQGNGYRAKLIRLYGCE